MAENENDHFRSPSVRKRKLKKRNFLSVQKCVLI